MVSYINRFSGDKLDGLEFTSELNIPDKKLVKNLLSDNSLLDISTVAAGISLTTSELMPRSSVVEVEEVVVRISYLQTGHRTLLLNH